MSIFFDLIRDLLTRNPHEETAQAEKQLGQLEQLQEKGRLEGIIAGYHEILKANPGSVDALFGLGAAYETQNNPAAADYYLRALAIDARFFPAKISLMTLMQSYCVWTGLEQDIEAIRSVVRNAPVNARNHLSPFKFLALYGATANEEKRCAERYAQIEYPPDIVANLRERLGFKPHRSAEGQIRLAYLSEDFHDHATARLMAEVFELHDRNRFHVTAYSYGVNDGSMMRARLERAFDSFVDIRHDTLEAAAARIHLDQTDILVDLKGYTLGTRSGILALRPASIQVNYLGYPGTLGADFVDYIIADNFIIPLGHEQYYSEKVVRLPDCYQPNDRSRQRPPAPARSECGLPEQGFVFCCFNQTYKITPQIFDVWCRLLKAVPGSCLWLWMSEPRAADNLQREMAMRGIDPARLIVAPTIKGDAHLARLQCADLFLDTLPYNAHTTCSDSLWMGLPVVTCAGDTFPSRVAGSLLTAMGVPELITYNLEDYFRLALDLATDKHKLDSVRRKITANRTTSPLFDCGRFTRNLEHAYEQMLQDSGRMPPARQNRSPA